jgi:hypothetical protein
VLRSFAVEDFFLYGWIESEETLPCFKDENILAEKKIEAKPDQSLWCTAQ